MIDAGTLVVTRVGSDAATRARLATIAGHLLVAATFLLPWIDGALGAGSALSGLRMAQLAADGAVVEVWGVSLGGAVGMIALYAWPALALDGALAVLLAPRLGLGNRGAALLSGLLGVPAVLIATGMMVVALWAGLGLVDGPAVSLGIALTASVATLLAAAWWWRLADER